MSNKSIEDIINFTEEKINHYAQLILKSADRADRACMGQLNFYISFRNIVKDYQKHKVDRSSLQLKEMRDLPSYRDFGLIEAVNDTLVFIGLMPTAKFFQVDGNDATSQGNVNTIDLLVFIDDKINHYSSGIPENPDRADRAALGQLNFYISFRNVIKQYHEDTIEKKPMDTEKILDMPSYRDFGLIGAVNDVLVFIGIYEPTREKKKFFHAVEVINDDRFAIYR